MTTLEAEELVYTYLDGSSLKTAITSNQGTIYKGARPVNDKNEAVEIVGVVINNQQLSEGLVNVNIYVPNQVIKIGGIQDDSQPNHARLKSLAVLAQGILKDVFIPNSDFGFEITNQLIFSDEVAKEHYINFRLRVYSINLN